MPAADWTSISNGSGTFAIIADLTAPSPPDVMEINNGGQAFQNITGGTFKDSRITGWCNQFLANGQSFYLILRSLDDTTFITAPATFFLCQIRSTSATNITIIIQAIVNGVSTAIASLDAPSLNGNPVGTWQQYQFSAFNSGTDILLRLAQWNGSSFIPFLDCAAPLASFPTLDAAGSCRFGALITGGDTFIDDIGFYSLT